MSTLIMASVISVQELCYPMAHSSPVSPTYLSPNNSGLGNLNIEFALY